jgi:hypothetical protein
MLDTVHSRGGGSSYMIGNGGPPDRAVPVATANGRKGAGNEPALAGGRRRGGCIFGGGGEWMSGKG